MKTKNILVKTTCWKIITGRSSTVCAALWLLLPAVGRAQDYTYTIDNDAITITGYTGSDSEIIIPDTIEGLPVVGIGDYAFFNYSSLTNVIIPGSVTSIGGGAFMYCYGLIGVTIPNSVTNIGASAFFNCTSLIGITLPGSVASIEDWMFSDCTSLARITIPGSVISIKDGAFANCTILTSITIPGALTNIGNGAFSYCASLTAILFKGNAPGLGLYVFDHANKATVYYLPGTKEWGPVFGDRPAKRWNPQVATNDSSFGVRTNQFGFNITGDSGLTVVVEACADLANPLWSQVGTNTLTGDPVYFGDPAWTDHPGRFYRLSPP
jgi:hypothetical protein